MWFCYREPTTTNPRPTDLRLNAPYKKTQTRNIINPLVINLNFITMNLASILTSNLSDTEVLELLQFHNYFYIANADETIIKGLSWYLDENNELYNSGDLATIVQSYDFETYDLCHREDITIDDIPTIRQAVQFYC